MSDENSKTRMNRREMLGSMGKAAAAAVVLSPLTRDLIVTGAIAGDAAALNAVAGIDRVTVLPEKTYLIG